MTRQPSSGCRPVASYIERELARELSKRRRLLLLNELLLPSRNFFRGCEASERKVERNNFRRDGSFFTHRPGTTLPLAQRTRGEVMGLDYEDEDDAVEAEQHARMEALCEEFEELCRELRYHQKE